MPSKRSRVHPQFQTKHRVGTRRLAGELVQDVTGAPLSARPYIEYLESKFSAIYGLD